LIPFSAHFALDYRDAARDPALLHNLSAVAVAGRFLWTASDEGRSLECLEPDGDGYRLRRQYRLDSLFPACQARRATTKLTSRPLPSTATDCGFAVLTAGCGSRRKAQVSCRTELSNVRAGICSAG